MKAIASGRDQLPVTIGSEVVVCLAARALLWPRQNTLFVADVHLGKAASFRAAGVPLPGGHSAHDLDRLTSLIAAHTVRHLVVLGDLIHARQSYTALLDQKFRQFRTQHRDIDITLVRGNHDRHAGDPPASWGVALQSDPFTLGPFACLHEPADSATPATSNAGAPIAIELSGHLHPAFRLTTSRESVALPCFWWHHRGVVLPSFGSFTGSSPVPLDIGESAIVVAGQHLHHLMRRG